jgi:S-adenosylmethionine:tRNA ribosyltransferase-isomerase
LDNVCGGSGVGVSKQFSEFLDYELPQGRIAQRPRPRVEGEASSLLLHASCSAEGGPSFVDRKFRDFPSLLREGDLLVFNNSKVLPVRFFVDRGDSRPAEVLLLRPSETDLAFALEQSELSWEALARPMKFFSSGKDFELNSDLSMRVEGRTEDGRRLKVRLSTRTSNPLMEVLEATGSMPIPPYIREGRADADDLDRYQTIYAQQPGSVAAPTAGLHFTGKTLDKIRKKGVELAYVTLHVGPASFQAVQGDVANHPMPQELCEIDSATAAQLTAARREGRRVVAVGTTTVRTLESAALRQNDSSVPSGRFATELLIAPGFEFNLVDAFLTNFHQPRTSHLLLVAAYLGGAALREAYAHALAGDYFFLSYGDSMFLDRI